MIDWFQNALAQGCMIALIALGYTMVYGVLQLINFAHSEVFMYGTFAAAWTVMEGRLASAFDASTADEAVRTQTTDARNLIENSLLVNWATEMVLGAREGSGAPAARTQL